MRAPILSIIIPVFNSEKYVAAAIESILKQTHNDFELIIIDDGSTDNSLEIIRSFRDNRIRIIINDSNQGIVFSRNMGLQEAKGEYIGMFDSDDIAYPAKFEKQIEFLEMNKEFGMVGTWVNWIDENGDMIKGGWKLRASSHLIPAIMLFRNYFLQSTVVYRAKCFSNLRFQEGLEIGEDYRLWIDIASKYKVWNLQAYLVKYRIHSKNITGNKELLMQNDKVIFTYLLKRLEIAPSTMELELHMLLKNDDNIRNVDTFILLRNWLEKIVDQNKLLGIYKNAALIRVVFNRWLKACYKARPLHFRMILIFLLSRVLRQYVFAFIKLALKGGRS